MFKIANSWNSLAKSIKNPFCLKGFVKQFMEFYRSKGWTPLLFVVSNGNTIVGLAPLMTKKKFGVRLAKLVGMGLLHSDFIVKDEYREALITETLDFVFKSLRCHFFDLTVPSASKTLRALEHECRHKSKAINVNTIPTHGHFILPIENTWNDFESMKGRNFKRKFKRMERALNKAGAWKTIYI